MYGLSGISPTPTSASAEKLPARTRTTVASSAGNAAFLKNLYNFFNSFVLNAIKAEKPPADGTTKNSARCLFLFSSAGVHSLLALRRGTARQNAAKQQHTQYPERCELRPSKKLFY
jgi:hypothetical protein